MRKFHWISMALLAAPFAFTGACGGDDTTGGGTAGSSSSTAGSGGSGTAGTSSTGGSSGSAASTGGSSGSASTGGSSGSGGSGTGGTAGTAAPDSGSAGSTSSDAAAETASGDDGSSTKCTNGQASGGDGKSCKDLCDGYFKVCKTHAGTTDTYANQAACITACKMLTQVQLCCRAQHAVTIASMPDPMKSDLDLHCPHVIGMSPCT